jgi:hypothetical protein
MRYFFLQELFAQLQGRTLCTPLASAAGANSGNLPHLS